MGIVCGWISPSRSEHIHRHLGSIWGDLISLYEQGDRHHVTVEVVVVAGIVAVDSAAVVMVEVVTATGDPDPDQDRDLLTTGIVIEEYGFSN